MSNLTSYTIDRKLSSLAIEATSLIPWEVLKQMRARDIETHEEDVFNALDHMGINVICDLISQGVFPVDVANSLDIPAVTMMKWIEKNPHHMDDMEMALKCSAQAHLSEAMKMTMDVGASDVDASRVAKTKTDLLKWLASRHDPDQYGDKARGERGGGVSVGFNIQIGGHAVGLDQKTVIDI